MPRVKAKLLSKRFDTAGRLVGQVQFNRTAPHEGEFFTAKWGSNRTLPQNALYWVYLEWLINDAGLKDQGHFSAVALHDNLKEYFKEDSTAVMSKSEFSEYFEKVDNFIRDFFEIDTTPFWDEHKERTE